MKRLVLVLAVLLCLGDLSAQEKVSVAAAANISSLAPELGAAFAARYPAYRAEFGFGASGGLVTQILNGYPVQLFMSADMDFAKRLVDAGLCEGGARVYARGSLILLSAKRLDLSRGLAVLADAAILQVAVANPETAPYGRAAREALTRAGLWDRVKAKVVTAQSIAQALQFTLGSADAGLVNKSALYSTEVAPYRAEGRNWIPVDPSLYSPIDQGFVLLRSGAASAAARAFAGFLGSPEARAVFAAHGYELP